MTAEARRPEDLTFGEALGELEQIVRELESGQLELEESLERYERGVALLRGCKAKLTEAQQRVTMLIGELEADEGAPGAGAEGGE
jgi:exodeoxyribonuclease VII small subunit